MPELIDLLVVTVEAGLSLSAALQLAGERMQGPLGDELRIVLQEQRMGLSPVQGLENMVVTKKGSRLSIQPVTKSEYDIVVKLGRKK